MRIYRSVDRPRVFRRVSNEMILASIANIENECKVVAGELVYITPLANSTTYKGFLETWRLVSPKQIPIICRRIDQKRKDI
jgi:hypothetical protein